jgi:geranylgeranyl diphosphate synthase type II
MEAALATEFFHTASLIADDLPCMDDDSMRRSRPSLHVAFGEGVALLASYGLIAEGFGKIEKNGRAMKGEREPFSSKALEATSIALEYASRFSGMQGASLGQFFDLYRKHEGLSELEEMIYLKTITLFEGAFVLGWLFGGGEFSHVQSVEKLALHFGMAFQIRDDLKDFEPDLQKGSSSNYAVALGKEAAQKRLEREVEAFSKTLKLLSIESPEFNYLSSRLLY